LQAVLPVDLKLAVRDAVTQGVDQVFWTVTCSALLCLFLPKEGTSEAHAAPGGGKN
jgi:hypothetical protein